jgi:hypothetical protein
MWPSRRPKHRKGILLNTMPKSGSIYIAKSLSKILGLPMMHLGNRYALVGQVDVHDAYTFSAGGFVSHNHLAPSPENLQVLQHFKLKMVLHLRDPRQALLSWLLTSQTGNIRARSCFSSRHGRRPDILSFHSADRSTGRLRTRCRNWSFGPRGG